MGTHATFLSSQRAPAIAPAWAPATVPTGALPPSGKLINTAVDDGSSILSAFSPVTLKALAEAFATADSDGSGDLDPDEFIDAIRATGLRLTSAKIGLLFEAADVNGDGRITIDEFLAPLAVSELLCELPTQPKTVVTPYQPSAAHLWSLRRGTIWQVTARPALTGVAFSAMIAASIRIFGSPTWPWFTVPDPTHNVASRLLPLAEVWEKQLALTTFVVTFFVAQSLAFWNKVYDYARSIGSRLSDLNLLLAAHAARDATSGEYTADARALLTSAARHTRLFYILYWASIVPRYAAVSSEAGLRRLRDASHCNDAELTRLLAIPRGERHHAVAMWLVTRGPGGCASGALVESGNSFSHVFMEQSCAFRSACGKIGYALAARMPMVYVHLVQVLVDTLLLLAPVALYAKIGAISCLLHGVLTVFYRGLVHVCKSFLDPFGKCETDVELQVPVLVREFNTASTRFLNAAEFIPAPSMKLQGKK